MTGTVVKGIGVFYFVHDGRETVMGKARGNLKRNKEIIYVGDIVDFEIDENDKDNE
jgi:ribosome biogenesis GTPase